MVKRNKFEWEKENIKKKYELLYKKKVLIKKKERVDEFFVLRKSWNYGFLGVKGYIFKDDLSLIFTKLAWCYKI